MPKCLAKKSNGDPCQFNGKIEFGDFCGHHLSTALRKAIERGNVSQGPTDRALLITTGVGTALALLEILKLILELFPAHLPSGPGAFGTLVWTYNRGQSLSTYYSIYST